MDRIVAEDRPVKSEEQGVQENDVKVVKADKQGVEIEDILREQVLQAEENGDPAVQSLSISR